MVAPSLARRWARTGLQGGQGGPTQVAGRKGLCGGIGESWDSDQEQGDKAPTSRQGEGRVWPPESLGSPTASEALGQLGSPCSLPEPPGSPSTSELPWGLRGLPPKRCLAPLEKSRD